MTSATTDVTGSELPACRLRRVTRYIDENLPRELPLAKLSALVHMSPFHFARLFKRSTGMPPHRFVVRRRIDEAIALLAGQTAPIADIARAVGFRRPSHFTTTFRRMIGMTPSAYRNHQRDTSWLAPNPTGFDSDAWRASVPRGGSRPQAG